MTTNDNLRGLLKDCRRWYFGDDLLSRIDAALAERDSGEVVPKVLSDAIKSITLCSDCRLDHVCCRPLLRAAHDYINTNKAPAKAEPEVKP